MGPVHLQPITWQRLVRAVTDRLPEHRAEHDDPWLRVAVDGAPAADPGGFAAQLTDVLREQGRPTLSVDTHGFLRPASLRFEFGHEDVDSYYDGWFDTGALWREVFGPLEAGGSGRVLPDLWDPERDRATRSPYVQLPPGGVLVVHGPFLLGHWYPFDLVVHLALSSGALRRRTSEAERWTLPAFARYESEVAPAEAADVLVRADDPNRPAWRGRDGSDAGRDGSR
ncbi:uridine kinase [Streptomyces sp. YIM 130001]|uniref:uridine kinase n=1 Tax=Streptomyces sp. YIM 130001 TaxID=2259644 RepID=UPI000E65E1B6|nr:uridine kinase [Streptomyces sp. YIM 130001]